MDNDHMQVQVLNQFGNCEDLQEKGIGCRMGERSFSTSVHFAGYSDVLLTHEIQPHVSPSKNILFV